MSDFYSEEDAQLAASVDRFVRQNPAEEATRDTGDRTSAVWRELAELGWLFSPIPEQDGGLGGSPLQTAIIAEGLGRALAPHAYPECVVSAAPLVSGTDSRLLADVGAGEALVAAAFDEAPDERANRPKIELRKSQPDRIALSGSCKRVLSGDRADHLIVAAVDPSTRDTLLVLVPANTSGVERKTVLLLDGRSAADITLTDVELPSTNVLRRGREADEAVARARSYGALAVCAEAVGAMSGALGVTRGQLETRHQFGAAIGANQVLRHRFADMHSEIEQARSAVFGLAASIGDLAANERDRAVSLVKARVSKASRYIGEQSIQLHGGIGMTDEHVIGRFYKRLLVLETMFGDRTHHLRLIAASY